MPKKKKEEKIEPTEVKNKKEIQISEKNKKNQEKKEIVETTIIKKESIDETNVKSASFLERLGAIFIDFILVSMIVSLLTYPFINNSDYNKLSKELDKTMKQYTTEKIDAKTYLNRSADINYDIARKSGLSSIISIFAFCLYFIVFQFKNGGQTFGKKIFKIKVIKKDNTELTINDIMFRSLIVDFILYDIIVLCFIIFTNKDIYFYGVAIFELIQWIMIVVTVLMILSRKDKRGLHDIITNTKVIKEEILVENVGVEEV